MRATTSGLSVLLLTALFLTVLTPGAALVSGRSSPANAATEGDDRGESHEEHNGDGSAGATAVCPSTYPPTTSFSDLASSFVHAGAVGCMVGHGIVKGRADGTFGTHRALTRGQMASLLARFLAATAPVTTSTSDRPTLGDVGDSVHRQNIEMLLDLGITTGRVDGTFGPSETVTREQLAAFLYRTHHSIGMTFQRGLAQPFQDVASSSVHAGAIAALKAEGIIQGLTATSYRPRQPVTRGQTATLLARSAEILHEAGLWEGEIHAATEAHIGATGEWPVGVTLRSDGHVVVTGHAIIEGDLEARTVTVTPGSKLEFAPEGSTSLTVSGSVVVEGALEMQPVGHGVDHVLRFFGVDEAGFVGGGHQVLESDTGLWFTGNGRAELAGTHRLPWTRAAASLAAGSTVVELEDDPAGWQVGDELTITPTNVPGSAGHSTGYSSGRIVSISGRSVTLDTPLAYDHPRVNGRWGAEVLNLTRNVRIEGTLDGRAHVLFNHTNSAQVLRNVALRYLGPRQDTGDTYRSNGQDVPITKGVLGRYPLHFHHNETGSIGTMVENVVVRESGHRAFVAHASDGITFNGTIAHDVFDSAYWWDRRDTSDGLGHRAVWERGSNDVVYDRAVASLVRTDPSFRGYRLSGFQLGHGSNMRVTNSVAVGVQGNLHSAGFNWPEGSVLESAEFEDDFVDFWTFDNNVAHNNRMNGIFAWQNTGDARHIIAGSVLYHNGQDGINHGAYSNRYTFTDMTLYGNGHSGTRLHAQGGMLFDNMTFDGAGISEYGFRTTKHRSISGPATLRNARFSGYTTAAIAFLAAEPTSLDIINPTFDGPESSWFHLADHVPPESQIRVQLHDGTAFQLHPASSDHGELIPHWNARRQPIQPFG